jgi:hypothetical protein
MSQVVPREALTRLLVERGIFAKEEFLEMLKVIEREMKRIRGAVHKRIAERKFTG